jgi:hypothetical protein
MLELTRLPDWDRRLVAVIARHRNEAAEWGVSDCLLTAMDAVEAVTGVDPVKSIRGRYKTERGAAGLLRRRGFGSLGEALAANFPRVGKLMAKRGDLALIEIAGVERCGYVTEHGIAVRAERGLSFHPQTTAIAAWRVG